MDKTAHPLETILDFAWAAGADQFWVNNAKDELKRMRHAISRYEKLFNNPVAYALLNDRGDIYSFRYFINPSQGNILPLYSDREDAYPLFSQSRLSVDSIART